MWEPAISGMEKAHNCADLSYRRIRRYLVWRLKRLEARDFSHVRFTSSWYKQVLTHCLLLFATSTGELLDSVKIYVNFPPKYYWRKNNHMVFYFLEKMNNILKANLLKGRDAKPEETKVRKFDHVSRLPLFPYHHNIWKRCLNRRDSDIFYTI